MDRFGDLVSQPQSSQPPDRARNIPIPNSGYVDASLPISRTPIFSYQKIPFKPSASITHLKVCGGYMVMGLANSTLLRLNLTTQLKEVIDLPKSIDGSSRIHQLFLDPSGWHCVVCMQHQESFYLHHMSKKPRLLPKFKGLHIDAVAWNRDSYSESSTAPILLATSRGQVIETELIAVDDRKGITFAMGTTAVEQYMKNVFDVNVPVSGIEFFRLQTKHVAEWTYFITLVSPGRMYTFFGQISLSAEAPVFSGIFDLYKGLPDKFLELPLPGNVAYSQLCVFRPSLDSVPLYLAWMAGPGVYWGNIALNAADEGSVIVTPKLFQYSSIHSRGQKAPLSITLTEFHMILMFADCIKIVCILNEEVVYEESFKDILPGDLLGIWRDEDSGTVWAYTQQAVVKYRVNEEARDVWKLYLEQGDFDKARAYARDRPADLDIVFSKQAASFFGQERFEDSARIYAMSQASFEEVTLRFIRASQDKALKIYLEKRLASLQTEDFTQAIMLVTWLLEMWLTELGKLKDSAETAEREEESGAGEGWVSVKGVKERERLTVMKAAFRSFLAEKKDVLVRVTKTVYDLIGSHGAVEDVIYFAEMMKDYERVISYRIQAKEYMEAIECLRKQADTTLVYKFSPVLVQHVPEALLAVWKGMEGRLNPQRLIPALIQYEDCVGTAASSHDAAKEKKKPNVSIQYLEFCIIKLKNESSAIHNYLMSLYVRHKDPVKLMSYLKMQGQDKEAIPYDEKYALRLCSDHSLHQASTHIYTTMELYEEAVDLSLKQSDLALAKDNANKAGDTEEKKKLWLKIARHVVEEEKDVEKAMALLQECTLLKIEDILPFFPDFVTIDKFKDAIQVSLTEYNEHIGELRQNMEEATESAEEIRREMLSFRGECSEVHTEDRCALCDYPLLTRGFYVFPCTHKFHTDCLIDEIHPTLTPSVQKRVEDLKRMVGGDDSYSISSANSMALPAISSKAELDSLVAEECPLCGEHMIKQVDKPFLDMDNYDAIMKSWE